MRFRESTPVNDLLRVKNSNICKIPCFYQASLIQSDFLRGKSGHFLNGIFQRKEFLFSVKSSQNTRKSSITPRVGFPFFKYSLVSAHGDRKSTRLNSSHNQISQSLFFF